MFLRVLIYDIDCARFVIVIFNLYMSTSQQHLNKIRKWLRKKELDQTKSKVRNAMLKSYEQ